MTKFKVGDRVRRTKLPWGKFDVGTEAVVSQVGIGGFLRFPGDDKRYDPLAFELVDPPSLPLTTVLQMDREIAKAGGSADILNDYLDRPLSDFVQNVMAPNRLQLRFAA